MPLESDDYQPSDMAWLDMKENPIDVVIGPIETYEDLLFGAKAAHEGFVLIKDMEWSERLARFAALLPGLQESLPVAGEYKAETPGTDSDLKRLRRRLLRRRRERGGQDDRDQPSERRGSPARQGNAAAPAQERDAGQVRRDHGADHEGADRRGSAGVRRLRRLLREHDVPRGGARARRQEHDHGEGDGAGSAARARLPRWRKGRPMWSACTW